MGSELKRVALDFDWPLDKVWQGFINPFYAHQIKCPHCENGYSPEYTKLEALWYSHKGSGFTPEMRSSTPFLPTDKVARTWAEHQCSRTPDFYGSNEAAIHREAVRICAIWNSSWSHHLNDADVAALIKADRLWDFTRIPRPNTRKNAAKHSNGWLKKDNGYIPSAREVNEWSLMGMGHDSINCWIVLKAELKRFGQPHQCAHCKGHGSTWPSDRVKRQCAAWKPKEPPKGEGYQIWETVSEGSPISPVFATPEELATHMKDTRWGGDQGTSYESWLSFIRGPGWAPSGVMVNGQWMSGVEAVTQPN